MFQRAAALLALAFVIPGCLGGVNNAMPDPTAESVPCFIPDRPVPRHAPFYYLENLDEVALPSEAAKFSHSSDYLESGSLPDQGFVLLLDPAFDEAYLIVADDTGSFRNETVSGDRALGLIARGCVPLHNELVALVHSDLRVHLRVVAPDVSIGRTSLVWDSPRPVDGHWLLITAAPDQATTLVLGGAPIALQEPSPPTKQGRLDLRAYFVDGQRGTSYCYDETTLVVARPVCKGSDRPIFRVFSGQAAYALQSYVGGLSAGLRPLRFCASAAACVAEQVAPETPRYADVRIVVTTDSATFSWLEVNDAQPPGAVPSLTARANVTGEQISSNAQDVRKVDGRWHATLGNLAVGQEYTYDLVPAVDRISVAGHVTGTFHTLSAPLTMENLTIGPLDDRIGCFDFTFQTTGPGLHFPFLAFGTGLAPDLPIQGGRWYYWQPRDLTSRPAGEFTGNACTIDQVPDMDYWAVAQMTVGSDTVYTPVARWRLPPAENLPFADFQVVFQSNTSVSIDWTYLGQPDRLGQVHYGLRTSLDQATYLTRDESEPPNVVLNELVAGAEYLYRVAHNVDGRITYSNEMRFTMPS